MVWYVHTIKWKKMASFHITTEMMNILFTEYIYKYVEVDYKGKDWAHKVVENICITFIGCKLNFGNKGDPVKPNTINALWL